MKKTVFKYADSKFLYAMISLITVEQMSSAAGTYFLAIAGKHLADFHRLLELLIAFVIVSQIPSLILISLRRLEMRGYLKMYFSFLDERLLKCRGRTKAWARRDQKETYLTAIGSEAETYISAVAFSYFDIYTYFINLVFSSLAISLAVDLDFLWAFLVSALLSFAIYGRKKKSVRNLVEEEQKARLDFSAYILKAWDNVLLANSAIHERYQAALSEHFNGSRDLAGRSAVRSMSMVFWMNLAASLPIFILDGFLLHKFQQQPQMLAAMVITLPRQLQILGVFKSFFQQITNLEVFQARYKTVTENSQLEELDLKQKMDLSGIEIDGQGGFQDFQEIIEFLASRKTGRILVSGRNGSGKSSLLLLLNAHLRGSFYLPPAPQLEIGAPVDQVSTGQRVLKHLAFLAREGPSILLLDEWDANLDAANAAEISEKLNQLSQQKLIVEVRHL